MTLKDLRHQRRGLVTSYQAVAGNAATRDLTPDEQTQIDGFQAQIDQLDARITTLEASEELEAEAGDDGADGEPAGRSAGRRGAGFEGRDLPDTDGRHPYSLMKVFRHIGGMGKLDGLEGEMHAELAKRSQKTKGVLVPWHLATHRNAALSGRIQRRSRPGEFRDATTATGVGSIAAILSTDLIDLLRNKMLTQSLGALVLSNMEGGTFSIPKKTSGGAAYWLTEGIAPTQSNAVIGQTTFTGKSVGAFTDLTRKFMLQTSLDAEAFARDELTTILALEIDRAALNGSGTGAEPQGLMQRAGVPTVALGTNGAVPTFQALVDLETATAAANADVEKMAYVTTAKGRGKLKTTLKASAAGSTMLWDAGEVNGYGAFATNQLPSNLTKGSSGATLSPVLFGNWADLAYALWGALDIIEDPYAKSTSGGLRIVALQELDIQTRRDESFAKIVDMVTV